MLALAHAHTALRRLADELNARNEARLPTERALAERLGTSRTTVRKALELLESDGTIRRVRGRAGGAYLTGVSAREVSPAEAQPYCRSHGVMRSLNTVKGIPEILHEQGFADGTSVIRAALVTPSGDVHAALGLPAGAQVVSLLRLRYADGETLSLEQMYLLPELAGVLRTPMSSIYRTLHAHFGLQICVADESIEVAAVPPAEAALLGRAPGSPVLKVLRTGYDQHGRAVEYSIDLFRADRTRLHVRSQSQISARPR
jgi:GntR family transcriptional regulator